MDVMQYSMRHHSLHSKVASYARDEDAATDPAVKAAFATIKAYYAAELAALTEEIKQNLVKTVSGTS